MGFWGTVGSVVSSWFGSNTSSSTSSYNSSVETIYEPDKVKIAELEKDRANIENKRVSLMADAQKEIIELNARMQGAIIEAESQSFEHSAKVLKNLMHDMNLIAQQRLELLENGQFEIVRKIETLYLEFEREVQKDNDSFQLEKLPKMFDILERFPPESSSHKLYTGSIDKQINLNIEFVSKKLSDLSNRQKLLIESTNETKIRILEQSSKIVEDRMKFLDNQLESRKELATLHKTESIQEVKKLTN